MFGRIILVLICGVALGAHGEEWHPSPEFLRAVRYVESSNGRVLNGDNGDSLGEFQLSEAAWLDVNKWRQERRLKTYKYEPTVFHSYISRVYASNYLTILHQQLRQKLHRAPSHAELYAAYNMGLAQFAQCGYRLSEVNPVTRAKCRQIVQMLSQEASL